MLNATRRSTHEDSAFARQAAPVAMLQRLNSLPRDGRDTLFLLLVIGWVILPQVGNLPLWCSALAGALLAWRGWLAVTSRPLPGQWWVFGLLAVSLSATFATHRTLLGRDAGVTLIVMLLALKTLELRARRDIFVVFFLGFFTMLTNFFFSQSLATAAAMLVALLGLLTALVNAHMPVGKPPLADAARTAAWMTLLGAPVMAALFVLFPRVGPLWGIPSDAMSGRSGLSATMQVGNLASLVLDQTIAMRVKFQGRVPPQSELYFRGPVMSSFDGREWRPLLRLGSRPFPLLGAGAQLQVSGEPVRYEVTLEPSNRPWIMVLDAAATAPVVPGFETVMTSELLWLANRPVTDLLRYRAESYTSYRHGPRTIAAVLPEYLDLPPGFNPRTLQMAAQMRSDPDLAGRGPEALVQAALGRLRTGNYHYTLDPGVYGRDSADEFWFDRREGFCEHIASAFVVLMRGMGIPARLVTGYQGGELNGVDGFWIVRQSDAHAWTEVWLAGRGWVRVDPTAAVAPGRTGSFQRLQPPQGVIASAFGTVSPDLAANVRAAWEALNNSWNQWVLNYTQSKQLDLLKNLGFASPSWEDLSYVLLALLVALALTGAAWTLWERRQHDPWLRLLMRVQRRLGQAGVELPASTPPRQIATLVTVRFGEAGRALADWLLKLESQRYARNAGVSLTALQREYKQLEWPT
ncbi:MAG: putative rane protein [Ramlibacter sp.]|jgi:transglutaminase-like putative cysteine protease|nr:putative rane protein [Ramlibacter sp.]